MWLGGRSIIYPVIKKSERNFLHDLRKGIIIAKSNASEVTIDRRAKNMTGSRTKTRLDPDPFYPDIDPAKLDLDPVLPDPDPKKTDLDPV